MNSPKDQTEQTLCDRCGKPMVFNVPRIGEAGGYVHQDTGTFLCQDLNAAAVAPVNTPKEQAIELATQAIAGRISGIKSYGDIVAIIREEVTRAINSSTVAKELQRAIAALTDIRDRCSYNGVLSGAGVIAHEFLAGSSAYKDTAAKDAEIERLKAVLYTFCPNMEHGLAPITVEAAKDFLRNNVQEKVQYIEQLTAANARIKELEGQRDGRVLDEHQACRVCGGTLPKGHNADCEFMDLEKDLDAAEARIKGKFLHSTMVTCIHHTDAERAAAKCPVCQAGRIKELEAELEQCQSALVAVIVHVLLAPQ